MTVLDILQTNTALFVSIVAMLSLLVGSFLNVVIHRLPIMMENAWARECQEWHHIDSDLTSRKNNLPENYNLVTPSSCCPSCNTPIKPWQNIPVVSYILLKGKCHKCSTGISIQYPIIEAITALLSALVAYHYGVSLQTVSGIIITWSLITLTMIDFKHTLLPDDITLPILWLGLLASLVGVFVTPQDAIVGAAFGYLSLWSVYQIFKLITGKEGMGYGDFKLLALFGAWFGWQSIPIIILLSSVVGATVGISLIVISGRDKNIPIPFGPYLAAAGWLVMMYGDTLQTLLP